MAEFVATSALRCLMIGHFAMKLLVKGNSRRLCTCRCAVSRQASADSAHDLHGTPHVLLEAKSRTNTPWVEVAKQCMEVNGNTRQTY